MAESVVRCLPPDINQGGDERLPFEIDGAAKAVTLRIRGFNRALVNSLSDLALDLLEIAALVHGVDSAVSRGGLVDRQMAKDWYRTFQIEMPLRCYQTFNQANVRKSLQDTLQFLSGDTFQFQFVPQTAERNETRWFDFDVDDGWRAERVLMFSGGLDSFAGALHEVIEQGQRVALVSHFSATKIAPVQRALYESIAEIQGDQACRHIPVQIQLAKGTNREGTHRTRSFLFAVLGLITAQAFKLDRVSFHENGVVSLNLPPVGSVVNTRATRTTHPQTLARFSELFGQLLDRPVRVDNPFFWRTKTDVLDVIDKLGMASNIALTTSCADTHNRTKQHPHCGRCSQCIDRRFAVLASGLERYDPGEAYSVDLINGARASGIDREMALSYVRNASFFESLDLMVLERHFPEIYNAIGWIDGTSEAVLERLCGLLGRHGRSVCKVMREIIAQTPSGGFSPDSLPRLFGDLQRAQTLGLPSIQSSIEAPAPERKKLRLVVDQNHDCISINGALVIQSSATQSLLSRLAEVHLRSAGDGRELFDYELVSARVLAGDLELSGEEAVRRRIGRARSDLKKKFAAAGFDVLGDDLIENVPWAGYRLTPDLVEVRIGNVEITSA